MKALLSPNNRGESEGAKIVDVLECHADILLALANAEVVE